MNKGGKKVWFYYLITEKGENIEHSFPGVKLTQILIYINLHYKIQAFIYTDVEQKNLRNTYFDSYLIKQLAFI